MSLEQNKALVRRYLEELFNKGNIAVVDELNSADYVAHVPGLPPLDREGVKQAMAMYRAGLPDLRIAVEDLIAEGDKVVNRATYRGTHQGDFMGIPPTGKPIEITGINISRVAAGKIVEDWTVLDQLSMMQQLGAVPPPVQP